MRALKHLSYRPEQKTEPAIGRDLEVATEKVSGNPVEAEAVVVMTVETEPHDGAAEIVMIDVAIAPETVMTDTEGIVVTGKGGPTGTVPVLQLQKDAEPNGLEVVAVKSESGMQAAIV